MILTRNQCIHLATNDIFILGFSKKVLKDAGLLESKLGGSEGTTKAGSDGEDEEEQEGEDEGCFSV